MKLIIVESPSKAKTIEKYLGKEYKVEASGGHVRDLPEAAFGVDIKNNFEPKYVINPTKKDTIKKLKEAKAKADEVFLATDPDREGEAISWHLAQILKMKTDELNRIEFNEITETAVKKAIKNPRVIDLKLVDAQQARRVLDRIVGYKLSPIICQRIQPKLSAGRVQSVALRLVVEREREIQNFKPVEYWVISAYLFSEKEKKLVFRAQLANRDGKKFVPSSKDEADEVLNAVKNADFVVDSVKKSVTKSHAPAPYTTSTLQQDAANRLGLAATVTMRVAQQLYEGINITGEGHVALVTYIRTDSVRISDDAYNMAKDYITSKFGGEYLPEKRNAYKNKGAAQDAHEAIRPVSIERTPESLSGKLDRNQIRVYKIIYERFLASQMSEAQYNSITCEIKADRYGFKASGKTLLFKGFLAAYSSIKDKEDDEKDENNEENDNVLIPEIQANQILNLKELKPEQKFTKPPARFTDASLIKLLEENGIGRPSTYATILSVLLKRQYTNKEGKSIVPTEIAFSVSDFLVEHFGSVVNTEFTADVEAKFDKVEEGSVNWKQVMADFYQPFEESLEKVTGAAVVQTEEKCPKCGTFLLQKVGRYGKYLDCPNEECDYKKSLEERESDEICEKCGAKMVIKKGRYGEYLACSNYPDCSNIRSMKKVEESDVICDKCGAKMVYKIGRYGKFLACSNYPTCKNIKSASKPVCKCPVCGKDVYLRKSKTGKIFYGCEGYPDCNFVSWDLPLDKKCPKCGAYLVEKLDRNGSKTIKCSSKECDYKESETSDNE
ncbi:MAG: type I DNA topoisomerase [Clostridia bacterium]